MTGFGDVYSSEVTAADPAYKMTMTYTGFGVVKAMTDPLQRTRTYTSDALGRVRKIVYPKPAHLAAAPAQTMTYEGDLVKTTTDRRGIVTERSYDEFGRVKETKVGGVVVSSAAYNDPLHQTTYKDALNQATTYKYDGLGRVAKITNALQHSRSFTYDKDRLSTETDFNNNTTTYSNYDGADQVQSIQDAAGRLTTIAHSDAGGYTRTTTDRSGNKVEESHDALGRVASVKHGEIALVKYEYDGNSNRLSMQDGRGVATLTSYEYDQLNRLTKTTHPLVSGVQQVEVNRYDAAGNLLYYFDGRGDAALGTAKFEYDELDHLKTRTDGVGNKTLFEFDGEGLLSKRTGAKGAGYETSYQYNARRSLTDVNVSNIGAWNYQYDANENLKEQTQPLVAGATAGAQVKYGYDQLNRVERIEQKLSGTGVTAQTLFTRYGYDQNSNRTSVVDAVGQVSVYGYNNLNRLTEVSYVDGKMVGASRYSYGYNPEGALTEVTEIGKTLAADTTAPKANFVSPTAVVKTATTTLTGYAVDEGAVATGVVSVTVNNQAASYDARTGEWTLAVTLTEGGNSYTVKAKDGAGNEGTASFSVTRQTPATPDPTADVTAPVLTVTSPGSQTSVTTASVTVSGVVSDEVGVASVKVNGVTATVQSDGSWSASIAGLVEGANQISVVATDAAGNASVASLQVRKAVTTLPTNVQTRQWRMEYQDTRGRLTKVTDANGHTVTYNQYDAANNLTQMTDGGGATSYEYDAANRMKTVNLASGPSVTQNWYADGLLQSVNYAAGQTRNYAYDNADRVQTITNTVGSKSEQYGYGYDPHSNRINETLTVDGATSAIRTAAYEYDFGDRMKKATVGANVTSWSYDGAGNRLSETNALTGNKTYSYDSLNRLRSVNGATFEYDANGNLTSQTAGLSVTNYEYDARDQMRRVLNGTNEQARYDYDYERRRIGKTLNQGLNWQEYEYDGSRVVNEYQRTVVADVMQRTASAHYEYGIDLLRGTFGTATPTSLWYYSDALGSVTALSNASGAIQTAYGYNAWGERTVGNDWGGAGSPLNNQNAIGYTGQFFDNETGLMPLGNGERYYNPALGRFTQQDSFSGMLDEAMSLNRYSYVHNNPNKYRDPSGHLGLIATTAIGFGVGYVAGFLLDAAHQGVDILSGDQQGFDLERADASGQFAAKVGAIIGSLGVAAKAGGILGAFEVGLTIGGVGTGAAATAINLQEGRYGHAAIDAVATLLPFAFKGVRTATAKSFKDFGRGGYTGNVKPAGFQGWKQSWQNLKGGAVAETVVEGTRSLEGGNEPLLLNPAPEEVLQRGRANPIGEQGPFDVSPDGGTVSRTRGNQNPIGNSGTAIEAEIAINEEHIFEGEFRSPNTTHPQGRAVGVHYEGVESTSQSRSTIILDPPNTDGVYVARVEVFNKQTKSFQLKPNPSNSGLGKSTFFPKNWTKAQVVQEIRGAFANQLAVPENTFLQGTGNTFIGIGPQGLKIIGHIRPDGVVESAYPKY